MRHVSLSKSHYVEPPKLVEPIVVVQLVNAVIRMGCAEVAEKAAKIGDSTISTTKFNSAFQELAACIDKANYNGLFAQLDRAKGKGSTVQVSYLLELH